jgi:hypothetical protein
VANMIIVYHNSRREEIGGKFYLRKIMEEHMEKTKVLVGMCLWDVWCWRRQPRVNLLYSYLLSLCRTYRRTAAGAITV